MDTGSVLDKRSSLLLAPAKKAFISFARLQSDIPKWEGNMKKVLKLGESTNKFLMSEKLSK
jgi:hypothetical protein